MKTYNRNILFDIDTKYIKIQLIFGASLIPFFSLLWLADAFFVIKSIYFLTIVVVMLGYIFSVIIFSKRRWLKRYSKVIDSITFYDSNINVTTARLFWIREKLIKIDFADIDIIKKNMHWWAKKSKNKETYVLKYNKEEYYLISDYFAEIEEIIKKISVVR
jgi:hypothetical protein